MPGNETSRRPPSVSHCSHLPGRWPLSDRSLPAFAAYRGWWCRVRPSPGTSSGASQKAPHFSGSTTSGVISMPRSLRGASCCPVMRRIPDTTRNSGVRLLATLTQSEASLRLIARSLIVGVPARIAKRSRSSWSLSPSHLRPSVSPSTPARRPGAASYS